MASKTGEWKGSKTITLATDNDTLNSENRWAQFTFGVKKAELIVNNLAEVLEFAQANGVKLPAWIEFEGTVQHHSERPIRIVKAGER